MFEAQGCHLCDSAFSAGSIAESVPSLLSNPNPRGYKNLRGAHTGDFAGKLSSGTLDDAVRHHRGKSAI
jgi:hypothetical protein